MSTVKVNAIRGVGASSDAITIHNTDGTSTLSSGSKLNNCSTDGTTNLTVSDGNLVIGTAGHGIDFSATSGTGSSELLHDYEQGTFTPTVIPSGSAGTISYTDQYGWYIRVGNCVSTWIMLNFTQSGTSGNLQVGSLPFAASSSCHGDIGVFQCNDMENSWASNVGQFNAYLAASKTYMEFRGTKDNGAAVAYLDMQDMQFMRVQINYRTD